jgi:hypothetical protein
LTYGAGLRLRPLFERGSPGGGSTGVSGVGDYVRRNIDVGIDFARYASQRGNGYSKTWFYAISLSI